MIHGGAQEAGRQVVATDQQALNPKRDEMASIVDILLSFTHQVKRKMTICHFPRSPTICKTSSNLTLDSWPEPAAREPPPPPAPSRGDPMIVSGLKMEMSVLRSLRDDSSD